MNRPANAGAVHEDLIAVLGQRIRVNIRWGIGVPLVLCNGIGAGLEVLDPFVAHLNAQTTVVRFDVPGAGRSPNSLLPYRFPYLAAVLGALLSKAGVVGRAVRQTQVDVAGFSWGGALAQQFALQNPRRCRRLVLISTGTGSVMVPARPSVLSKMVTPRRFLDHRYAAAIAAQLYGGTARTDPTVVERGLERQLMTGSRMGYMHQLLAGVGWTSVAVLPLIRQPTLIIAGTDDPIIPLINAKIMSRLLPNARLYVHDGGHVELLTGAPAQARIIEAFRRGDAPHRLSPRR